MDYYSLFLPCIFLFMSVLNVIYVAMFIRDNMKIKIAVGFTCVLASIDILSMIMYLCNHYVWR